MAKLPVHMTVDEFLAWDSGDSLRYELVDGEPRATTPASTIHGLLQGELARRIGNHLRERGGGCNVIANPGVVPRLLANHNFRIPDLAVTCTPVTLRQLALPEPVLMVEILSPSNHAETWANVWAYTSNPSVQETLVLQSDKIAAELLRRSPDGVWPERTQLLTDGALTLESVGSQMALADLYADTPLAR